MQVRFSGLVPADGLLVDALVPAGIPGWDGLAAGRPFYVSAGWLGFADTDGVARSRYLGLTAGDGRLVAALSAHRAAEEIDPGYVAARALDLPAAGEVLTLGGRRGFLSGVLVDPAAPPGGLARLIRHATAGSAWWWPYLTTADAALVTGAGVHLVGADCVVDVVGASVEDHVAALPTRQRRTNFRRERQRFRASGLEIRRIGLRDNATRLGALLAAVQRKYGHRQTADEMAARLHRQAEHLGERAVVFGCFDGDAIVGFSLAYRWGATLALRVVGFDYARLRDAGEYAQLAVHAPLGHCYAHGLRQLHLGTGSYEAKCRRGARVRPLWAVTSFPGGGRESAGRVAGRIAASLPAHEAAAFTAETAGAWR